MKKNLHDGEAVPNPSHSQTTTRSMYVYWSFGLELGCDAIQRKFRVSKFKYVLLYHHKHSSTGAAHLSHMLIIRMMVILILCSCKLQFEHDHRYSTSITSITYITDLMSSQSLTSHSNWWSKSHHMATWPYCIRCTKKLLEFIWN